MRVIIPEGSLLDPSENAAVVGGNVLTSQRIVDVILTAFEICAASQGCMNNITLGTEEWGYYETVAGGSGAVRLFSSFPINCATIRSYLNNSKIHYILFHFVKTIVRDVGIIIARKDPREICTGLNLLVFVHCKKFLN